MENGGKREGAGRKKGQVAAHTLEAQEVRKALVERVRKDLQPLLNAKLSLALGHDVMIARKWESTNTAKGGYARHRTGAWEVIKDPDTIVELLNGPGNGDYYYQIVTEKPDNTAQNYLLDQVIGKAKESLEIDNPKEIEEVKKLNDKIDAMIENVKHTRK